MTTNKCGVCGKAITAWAVDVLVPYKFDKTMLVHQQTCHLCFKKL